MLTISRGFTALLSVITVIVAVLAANYARQSAAEAKRANDFDQRQISSAAITDTNPSIRDDSRCVVIPDEHTPLIIQGSAKMATGTTLWEVTQGVSDSSLWPGSKASIANGSSSWTMTIPSTGGASDRGHRYTLLLVSATPEAAHELDPQASRVGSDYKALTELPRGVDILTTLCVVRAT